MTHCSDDDLVLAYYGEPDCPQESESHLAACEACGLRYQELSALLDGLTLPEAPEPGEHYGAHLWQRIAPQLPHPVPFWRGLWMPSWSIAAAAVLVAAGFLAGRYWPAADEAPAAPGRAVTAPPPAIRPDDVRRRVLLSSVADHLERSGRVLTDIVNAPGGGDISVQQDWASDLLWAGRFYRQDALDADERAVAAVLDDLERALLDVVHGPSRPSRTEVEQLRTRFDAAALLFKVRVLGGTLRHRESAPRPDAAAVPPPSRMS